MLLGSAVVLAAAQGLGLLHGYLDALKVLVATAVAGLLLVPAYAPPTPAPRAAARGPAAPGAALPALLMLALFFVGQPGFTAYAAHIAARNGLPTSDLPLIYAASKGVAACVLLAAARRPSQARPTWLLSLLLALALCGLAQACSSTAFLAALLTWEVAVNLQSTRYQAVLLRRFPAQGGRWLMATIACGAAAGPVIHGALLERDLGILFLVLSLATAFIPVLWTAGTSTPRGS